jgi:trk system potassium uptake protein
MHAVVVGCGRVGAAVAVAVEAAGHTVAVVDKDRDAFRRLAVGFRGRRVVGLGFDRDRLLEAGIETAGAVAAVTNGDNSNIVVARVAHETFRVPRVVARIYDPRRAVIYERLGISTIAPVGWSTERVLERVLPEGTGVAWTVPDRGVVVVERRATAAWVHRSVAALEAAVGARVVALVARGDAPVVPPAGGGAVDPAGRATGAGGGGGSGSAVPGADDGIGVGDLLWLAVAAPALDRLDRALTNGTLTNGAPTNRAPTNRAPTNRAHTNRAPTNRAGP